MKHVTRTQRTTDRDLVVTREFNAPARLVFEAWTTPALMQRWWVPKSIGLTMTACEMDVRTGGGYRFTFVFDNDPSKPMSFFGKYLEVTPFSRLVYTHVFEPMAHVGGCNIAVTFTQQGESTLLVSRETYSSREVRQMVLDTGMEHGMRETMDQLDDLVWQR